MRKGQEKILKKAEKYNLSQEKKNFLMREDLSIQELDLALDFLYAYQNPDYEILEQIITNKQCQKYRYSLYIAIHPDTLPEIRDLYAAFQNPNIPDDKKGIIISMLGNGWNYLDCCHFFEEYQDAIEKGFNDYFISNEETEYSRFYKIFKMADNQKGNLTLWKEYAILALSDNRVVPAEVIFAVEHNIKPVDFEQYEYKRKQYIKAHVPLDILSEKFINTDIMQISCCYVNNLEKLQEVVAILNNENGVTVHNNYVYKMYISIAEKALNINLEYFSSASYNKDKKQWYGANKKGDIKLVVFYDGGVYYKLRNDKLVPLSVKKLLFIKHTYGLYGEKVFYFIMKNSMKQMTAPVLKDICRLIEETDMFLPPVTFNECKNVHNLNELFKEKWRDAYHINWNRTNINLGYMLIKSLPLIHKKDQNRLLALKDFNLLDNLKENPYFKWTRRIGYSFLSQIILSHIPEINEEEKSEYINLCSDYMQMSHDLHQPFKISFRSKKKIEDAHDKVAQAYNQKKNLLHKINIPKKSRFNQLRKMLPSSFEWIKNGNRLYREGVQMHHCVNSYYDLINNDICAIYSIRYKEKRYTIEFRQKNDGTYYFQQIQSQCDRGCPEEVKEWVNSFLK